MNESDIQEFWNKYPCGDLQVGGLKRHEGDYEAFFSTYDRFRYEKEGHILECLDQIDFKGKRVLEIGLGQGADSEQLIRRGAMWTGLDLTKESVDRVLTRLSLRGLPYEGLKQGSALEIPFPDQSFDIVFSHGVLHHIPDIDMAQREIHRVLKPNGELIAMVYAKWSINYMVSIFLARRVGLFILYIFGIEPNDVYGQHVRNAKNIGLFKYLKMNNFIHKNTDGPLNPYSKVYNLNLIREDFKNFRLVKFYKRFMYAPPFPIQKLPGESAMGWHLWVHLERK